jgi:hypothetical protein
MPSWVVAGLAWLDIIFKMGINAVIRRIVKYEYNKRAQEKKRNHVVQETRLIMTLSLLFAVAGPPAMLLQQLVLMHFDPARAHERVCTSL